MAMLKSSVVQGSLRVTDTTYTNDLVVGDLTAPTIKNGDYLLIADADNGNKILKGPTFDGSTATQALTKKGTWATFNNYSHPTGDGNLHVPATGTGNNGKFLKAGSTAGSISWSALPTASTSAAGIVKLDSATGTGETTAVTPKGAAAAATAAIQTLDSTLPTGSAASKTLTALTITDGKMTAATFSDISIGAGAIASGTIANARLPARLQEYHTTTTNTDTTFTSGWHYSNTNSPFTKYHSSANDFMVWAHAHTASKWGSEIATDFRSNRIAVRNINNGTWNSWKELGSFTGPVNEYSWTSDIIYDDIENEFTNTRATNSWASQVYSKHGFADGCYVSFRPVDATHYIMVGLNSDPTVDANWEKLDYAWYIQANGNIDIRESKTTVQSITGHTTYVANDDFRIEYSNGYIRYYHNGALCRTVARAISGQLYLDSTFYNGGSIKDLRFGPIKNINLASKDAPGLVPKGAAVSSQSTSTKFLREDGSWAAPSYIANAAYGNLSTAGKITTAITLATNDFLIIGDNSDGGKIGKGPTFNTSNTTKWLTQAGTWTTPTAANVGAAPSAGSSNITTVGTITSGTWNGTAIAADYIGNHSTAKLTSGTLPVARGGTGLTTSTYKNAVVVGNASTVTNAFHTIRTGNGAFYATATDGAPAFGTLPVAQGGTGKTTAAAALANLGGVAKTGDTMSGLLTLSKAADESWYIAERTNGVQIAFGVGYSGTNRGVYDMTLSKWIIYSNGTDANTGMKLYGAVWNDYAEFRQANSTEPGRVVIENGNDTLTLSAARLQPGAEIISDTFGFAIGKTDNAQTPIATSGRVLAYPYESREEFKANIGKPVCSGPNGTVSIMTQEEYEKYGYCAIGTISAVPDYEEWGSESVAVDGRVWIRVR